MIQPQNHLYAYFKSLCTIYVPEENDTSFSSCDEILIGLGEKKFLQII